MRVGFTWQPWKGAFGISHCRVYLMGSSSSVFWIHHHFLANATLPLDCCQPVAEHSKDAKTSPFLGQEVFLWWEAWAGGLISLVKTFFQLHCSLNLPTPPPFSPVWSQGRPALQPETPACISTQKVSWPFNQSYCVICSFWKPELT